MAPLSLAHEFAAHSQAFGAAMVSRLLRTPYSIVTSVPSANSSRPKHQKDPLRPCAESLPISTDNSTYTQAVDLTLIFS